MDCTAPDDVQARDLNCTSDTLESTHHINSSSLEYLSPKRSFLRENNGRRQCFSTTIRKHVISIGFEIFFGNAWRRHFQKLKTRGRRISESEPLHSQFHVFSRKKSVCQCSHCNELSSFRFELKEKGINLFVAGG